MPDSEKTIGTIDSLEDEAFILSFPGNGHQTKYVEQLNEIVRKRVPVKKVQVLKL